MAVQKCRIRQSGKEELKAAINMLAARLFVY